MTDKVQPKAAKGIRNIIREKEPATAQCQQDPVLVCGLLVLAN